MGAVPVGTLLLTATTFSKENNNKSVVQRLPLVCTPSPIFALTSVCTPPSKTSTVMLLARRETSLAAVLLLRVIKISMYGALFFAQMKTLPQEMLDLLRKTPSMEVRGSHGKRVTLFFLR